MGAGEAGGGPAGAEEEWLVATGKGRRKKATVVRGTTSVQVALLLQPRVAGDRLRWRGEAKRGVVSSAVCPGLDGRVIGFSGYVMGGGTS